MSDESTSLVPSITGQAALFDDPQRLLALSDVEWSKLVAHSVEIGGPILAEVRRAYGLICWAARIRLGDERYGEWLSGYGERLGVSNRTLYDWRKQAETALNLSVPSGRREPPKPPKGAGRKTDSQRTATTPVELPAPKKPDPGPAASQIVVNTETGEAAVIFGEAPQDGPVSTPQPDPLVLVLPDYPMNEHVEKVCRWLANRGATYLQRVSESTFLALSREVKIEANRRRDEAKGTPTSVDAAFTCTTNGDRHRWVNKGYMVICDACGQVKSGGSWVKT